MTTTISDGTTTLFPHLVLGWQHSRNPRTVVHQLLGRTDPDVTLRPPALRAGQLRLLALTVQDAQAIESLHAQAAVLTLTEDDLPGLDMSYVVSGPVTVALDDRTRLRWVVTVDYTEVLP